MVIQSVTFKFVGSLNCAFRETKKLTDIYFLSSSLSCCEIWQEKEKTESHPATSTPLKLAGHSDTSEVFYCSVYSECTQSGLLQVSLTKFAASFDKERRWKRLCHRYVQLYLHALCCDSRVPGAIMARFYPNALLCTKQGPFPTLPHPPHLRL